MSNIVLQNGVSGILRVKNDAEFLDASIDSCIDALDELIIVYNDCSDNSPDIIRRKQKQYPDKIRVWEYKHKIYSINLTKEEYEYTKQLPSDSPHLLCNYYNFALSKVSYQYAMKIDADQIYFTESLNYWCDAYRGKTGYSKTKSFIGQLYSYYAKIVNRLNLKLGRIIPLIKKSKTNILYLCYCNYLVKIIQKKEVSLSLSGIDLFFDKEWFVTIGKKNNIINILPPYNGVGDHLIFKVDKNVYYRPDDNTFYNSLRSDSYTYIERFVCPRKSYNIGFMWFHLNSMRSNVILKVTEAHDKFPGCFKSIEDFISSDYNEEIEPLIDRDMMLLYQRSMFQFIHQNDISSVINYKYLLNNLIIKK